MVWIYYNSQCQSACKASTTFAITQGGSAIPIDSASNRASAITVFSAMTTPPRGPDWLQDVQQSFQASRAPREAAQAAQRRRYTRGETVACAELHHGALRPGRSLGPRQTVRPLAAAAELLRGALEAIAEAVQLPEPEAHVLYHPLRAGPPPAASRCSRRTASSTSPATASCTWWWVAVALAQPGSL
jgi:hypothetical protein